MQVVPVRFTLLTIGILLFAWLRPAVVRADITTGLVGYWKFDETSGPTATDSSGSGNDGTHANGPTITSTVAPTILANERSLSFDGVDDAVNVGAAAAYQFGAGDFSYSAWIKTGSDGVIISDDKNITATRYFSVTSNRHSPL